MRDDAFPPPTPGHDTTYPLLGDTPQGSSVGLPASPVNASQVAFAPHASRLSEYQLSEKPTTPSRPLWRRPFFWLSSLAALAIIVIAVVVPVYFTVIKPNQRNVTGASGSSGGGSGDASSGGSSGSSGPSAATSGGNGSVVLLSNGTQITFINNFGGYWVNDSRDPFNNNARPNSWTPSLNTSWTWGKDKVYGVNLGGWFVLEPFITPALYQKYNGAIDEWTLSEAMAADTAGGGLQQLENHYNTFITEADFIQIAGAGLNWIRLPIPFWAIEKWEGEPFLEKVCWKYILQAFAWARKYGLRIFLDLHTIPGSQNGYNHSGKFGQVNFMSGFMGIANAQRALTYIRIFTEFISQPEYKDLIPLFGIVNEALTDTIGKDTIGSFYVEAMDMIRTNITGYGAGNGPYIAIGDGLKGVAPWAGFLSGSDRLVLDTHTYFAFDGSNVAPLAVPEEGSLVADGATGGIWPRQACQAWADNLDKSRVDFGVTVAGEMSNAVNDCGLFVRGVGNGPMYGGDCTVFNDWASWNASMKSGLNEFILASMDAQQDWFFWTWKIGPSNASKVEAPLWSYKLGLDNGWVPLDPRASIGKCAALVSGVASATTKTYSFAASQTGSPAPSGAPANLAQSYPWPPATLANLPDGFQYPTFAPMYTPTGTVPTLSMPAVTKGVSEGDGWTNDADKGGAFVSIQGCSYPPSPWDLSGATVPTAACGGSEPAKRGRLEARQTPAPNLR